MSKDFLQTPPRHAYGRDDQSAPRSPSKSRPTSPASWFTRSISSPSGYHSPASSRLDGSVTTLGVETVKYAQNHSTSSSATQSTTPTRAQTVLSSTTPSTSLSNGQRPPLPTLGSPFQPLKSQIPSVPRRLLVPTRGRLPGLNNGSSNSSASALPTSPPSAGVQDAGTPWRTGRHSRWGSVSMNSEGTPAAGMSSPAGRNTRSSITSKLGRPRSDSTPPEAPTPVGVTSPRMSLSVSGKDAESEERRWLCESSRFEAVEEDIQLIGYQIYAVEQWIVERNRKVSLLSVYTGDMKDKVTFTAFAPMAGLSSSEKDDVWFKAMQDLRRDGARPRETDKGVIMATSLANFRSDYTVVHIPDGDFLTHREQLFLNINLLRMGCSGRSVLTLQEPSDSTKERFVSSYYFREDVKPLSRFLPTVLELTRLTQIGLSLFDMFPMDPEQQNGLLCDATVEGLKTWVTEIGGPYIKVEHSERIADPMTVSGLITTVISMRNKLNSIGLSHVPKDPFLHPRQFSRALAAFINQRLLTSNPTSSNPSPPTLFGTSLANSSTVGLGFTAPPGITHVHRAYLNLPLMQRIDAAFEKYRATEAYKVHRVLFAKLDDFTSATSQALVTATSRSKQTATGTGAQLQVSAQQPAASSSMGGSKDREIEKELLDGTTDLAGFVSRTLGARGKDSFASPYVRYLWSGRLDQLEIKRWEGQLADAEKDREELRERERDKDRSDSEDELGAMGPGAGWSNKMRGKIGNWAERGKERVSRGRKGSVDLTSAIKDKLSHLASPGKAQLPSVVISRDPGDQLSGPSSGQVSPTSPTGSTIALGAFSSGNNSTLAIDESEYQRRVQQFNHLHPSRRPSLIAAARSMTMPNFSDPEVTSEVPARYGLGVAQIHGNAPVWSPPMSITSAMEGRDGLPLSRNISRETEDGEEDRIPRKPPKVWKLKRSFSNGDISFMRFSDCLPIQWMQLDVDICAQLLVFRRRTLRIIATQTILESLVQSSAEVNVELRQYHDENVETLQQLAEECPVVSDIEEAMGTVDAAGLDTDALVYEADSFDVPALWRMAQGPRQRVFAIRERAFGIRGKRRRVDTMQGRGRFNRVQRSLDGRERFVDWMGRTESDVDEESELPEIMPGEDRDDDSEYEVEMHVSGVSSVQSLKERAEAEEKAEAEGVVKSTSAWALELFSRWGRVLGVRGQGAANASVKESLAQAAGDNTTTDASAQASEDEGQNHEEGKTKTRLHQIPEESENEDEDERFHSAPSSKEHSRSPDR